MQSRAPGRSGPAPAKIADVARLAGVSVATVSRALANPDVVQGETRKRVLEAVRETGYTPNIAARTLRARRSQMVLVVVPNIGNVFFPEVLRGIEETLSAAGYGLIIANLGDSTEKEARYVDLACAGQVDGVLLLCGAMIAGRNRTLHDAGIPIVSVCERIPGETFPQVEIDNRKAATVAVDHLIGRGHTSIAYLTGPKERLLDQDRFAGYCDALGRAGLSVRQDWVFPGDFTFQAGLDAAARVLAMAPAARPTALFAANDEMAIGFAKAIQEAGLAVPQDMAIVGFDGIAFADFCHPPLTTMVQPRALLGSTAADLLVRRMSRSPETLPQRIRLDARLTVKNST